MNTKGIKRERKKREILKKSRLHSEKKRGKERGINVWTGGDKGTKEKRTLQKRR